MKSQKANTVQLRMMSDLQHKIDNTLDSLFETAKEVCIKAKTNSINFLVLEYLVKKSRWELPKNGDRELTDTVSRINYYIGLVNIHVAEWTKNNKKAQIPISKLKEIITILKKELDNSISKFG